MFMTYNGRLEGLQSMLPTAPLSTLLQGLGICNVKAQDQVQEKKRMQGRAAMS